MPQRTPNNPNTGKVVLAALKLVLVVDTRLTTVNPADPTGLSQVYIRSKYKMSTGIFPAVNLSTGPQSFSVVTYRGYEGALTAIIEYYDRWDQQSSTIDTIIQNMDDDLERIKANIESNSSLVSSGTAYTVSAPKMTLSPDKGQEDATFPGMTLLFRTLAVQFNLLPYDV